MTPHLPLEYLLSTRVSKKSRESASEKLNLTNQLSDIYANSKLFGDHRKVNTSAYERIFFACKFK